MVTLSSVVTQLVLPVVVPPDHTPFVLEAQAAICLLLSLKSPKLVVFDVDDIVINSIVLIAAGAEYPPARTDRVESAKAVDIIAVLLISPKSNPFPEELVLLSPVI